MSDMKTVIQNVIDAPQKQYTRADAQKNLRSLGILNNQNKVAKAYRGIVVVRKNSDGRK